MKAKTESYAISHGSSFVTLFFGLLFDMATLSILKLRMLKSRDCK